MARGEDMKLPKRVILSRKGLDQAAGGHPSPILPCRTMLSIPIPETNKGVVTGYADLGHQNGIPLPTGFVTARRKGAPLTGPVHLDPDLRPAMRRVNREREESLYGQDDGFATLLRDLQEDDLFLFFGWFREALYECEGRIRFVSRARDLHVIWGWLQVGEIHAIPREGPIPGALNWARHHPHIEGLDRPNNKIFVARPRLSFAENQPGAGIFPVSHDDLRLTSEIRFDGRPPCRSYWKLPAFFKQVQLGFHHLDQWTPSGDGLYGMSGRRGQEFVFDTSEVSDEVRAWLEKLMAHFDNLPQGCALPCSNRKPCPR
jgi:hypothetical protein